MYLNWIFFFFTQMKIKPEMKLHRRSILTMSLICFVIQSTIFFLLSLNRENQQYFDWNHLCFRQCGSVNINAVQITSQKMRILREVAVILARRLRK